MIERGAQTAVVVVLERHETERLQHTVRRFPHWAQDLSHAMHWPSLGLKGNFDKVALSERLRKAQQATGYRYCLKVCFGAATVFKPNRSQD